MLTWPAAVRIYVWGEPTSMRCSFDGLSSLVLGALRQDPLTGHLFVFFNRRGDQCRVLWWNRSGYCIWGTRLERGRFKLPWDGPASVVHEMEAAELNLILEGLELRGAARRARWNSTSVVDQSSVAASR